MLIKAASHLRPLIRLPSFSSPIPTQPSSIVPPTTFINPSSSSTTTSSIPFPTTISSSASTASSNPNVGGGSFTSNIHLLQNQTGQSLVGPSLAGNGSGLGNAGGAAPGWGGSGGGKSNFNGYTGFGRVITQTQSSQTTALQSTTDTDESLERDRSTLALRRMRERGLVVSTPSSSSSSPSQSGEKSRDGKGRWFSVMDVDGGKGLGRRRLQSGPSTVGGARSEQQLQQPRFRIVDVDAAEGQGQRRVLRSTMSDGIGRSVSGRISTTTAMESSSIGNTSSTTQSPSSSGATQLFIEDISSSQSISPSTSSSPPDLQFQLEIPHPSSLSRPLKRHPYLAAMESASPELPPVWVSGIRMSRTTSGMGRKRGMASGMEKRTMSTSTSTLGPESPAKQRTPTMMRKRSNSTSAATDSRGSSSDEAAILLSSNQYRAGRSRNGPSAPPTTGLYTSPLPDVQAAQVQGEMRSTLEELDQEIYQKLAQAIRNGDKMSAEDLIHRYRNPISITNPMLAAESNATPPPYFTINTYNIVLRAMNTFRSPGQPIGEILATYNELLEREMLPNVVTYGEVMTALLARDFEIRTAQEATVRSRNWLEWDLGAGMMDKEAGDLKQADLETHSEAVERLAKENNYGTALKLFHSAVQYNRHRPFRGSVYANLMYAAAARGDVENALAIWSHTKTCAERPQHGSAPLKVKSEVISGLIMTHDKAGNVEPVQEILDEFIRMEKQQMIQDGRTYEAEEEGLEAEQGRPKVHAARLVFHAALRAYARNNKLESFNALLRKMASSPVDNEAFVGTIPPISLKTYPAAALALMEAGEFKLAKVMMEKFAGLNRGPSVDQFLASNGLIGQAQLSNQPELLVAAISTINSEEGFRNDQRYSRQARLQRAIPTLISYANSSVALEEGKKTLEAMVTFLRANGADCFSPRNAEVFSAYANPLIEIAARFGDPEAVKFLSEWFEPLKVDTAQPDESVQTETASTVGGETESTSPTSVDSASQISIDQALTGNIREALGARSTMSPDEAYLKLSTAAAQGVYALPAISAAVLQLLSRSPGNEAKVRELFKISHDGVPGLAAQRQLEAWTAVQDQMLMACCHMGYLEEAGMYRAQLIEAGQAPSADAYATMIASAKDTTDDASVARELFAESQQLSVRPNLYLYNTIISKLSRARKAESAIELFQRMKGEGIRPSSVTYGAVINACCRVGDVESATTLFGEMQAMPNFKPRVPPYNTMMQLHLQTHPSRDLVLHYYNQLCQAGVPPSAHTYKLLLDAYGSLQPLDLDAMQVVFSNLCSDRKVPVQGTHWASVIYAYGRSAGNVDKAIEVFESIASHPSTPRGKEVEPVCWEAILSVLAQHKSIEKLDEYAERIKTQHVKATAYVNNMLIKGYSGAGEIEKARKVFESMADSLSGVAAPNNHPTLLTSSGLAKPTTTATTNLVFREPSSYEAMIRGEMAVGEKERAKALVKRLEERGYPSAVVGRIKSVVDDWVVRE